ncbi:ribbon-helix-helix domain-containing protein [Leisingera sp.]|uniref:ribbon-helix-helix domain-containing protein n=1 Tax=Leisingera sp. TaxID=1879318 RepID=UPI003A91CDBC
MCELFIGADPDLWENRTKSLRIDGMATSIRVERFFWDILEEIAARDAMTVNQLITKLYHESLDADHDLGNFTSFLRVCCGRYLALASNGEVTRDAATPLAGVDAPGILARERAARDATRKDAATPAPPTPQRRVN